MSGRGLRAGGMETVALVTRIEVLGSWVARTVDDLADDVASQISGPAPRRADLDIERRCRTLLEQRELPLAGAGFVAEPGLLSDSHYWLEWWTANPEVGVESCRRLAADTDPASVGFRDYTELPWFVTPRETGRMHVTGPYVDYVCTDQHTLTVTRPVAVDGRFTGVAGVDVLAATVERLLGPELDDVRGCAWSSTGWVASSRPRTPSTWSATSCAASPPTPGSAAGRGARAARSPGTSPAVARSPSAC